MAQRRKRKIDIGTLPEELPQHVNLLAAARFLGVSHMTVRAWVESGTLECVEEWNANGGRRWIRSDTLLEHRRKYRERKDIIIRTLSCGCETLKRKTSTKYICIPCLKHRDQ